MAAAQKIRFSVDTGGTFTDIVVLNEETGEFAISKVPTTPDDVLDGLLSAVDKARVNLAQVDRFFVHGSTTALNALLERKGAKVAYITTRGFRDVPQIGRINRPQMYDPKYHNPPSIVPRHLRFEVTERANAEGEVVTPLNEGDVESIAAELKRQDVRAVAVCLLHAHKNQTNERRIKELLSELVPAVTVALSSDIAAVEGEFERASTTILNAYLAPVVERSIEQLERRLKGRGFRSEIVLTRSDGGGMSAAAAKRSPINTLLSGPAGGVIGALYIAELTNTPNLVTADLGGTSFDVGIVKNGHATANQELYAAGLPVVIPNLDIRTIGAGGGSIAWIDSAGALHVGPQSAGAQPGPMCYGRGGLQPTVTDAALVNGYIDPSYFLGGDMSVDITLAEQGIHERIAEVSGISLPMASTGILKIALSHMMGAIHDILSQSGDDPRDFGLLAYGGGGPLFAAALLKEAYLQKAIIPIAPGNFSAWGMLMIDIRHDVVKALGKELGRITPDELRSDISSLQERGHSILEREGIPRNQRTLECGFDMRYVGQGHSVAVPFDHAVRDGELMHSIVSAFQDAYRNLYGYVMDLDVELVNVRIKATGQIPKPKLRPLLRGGQDARAAIKGRRLVRDMVDGVATEHTIYERSELLAENRIEGPAIVEESTTITPIGAGQNCIVDALGNLVISNQ